MTGWLRGSLDDLERHIMRNEVLASEHLDKLENRKAAADVVSRATYINCPPEIILERLMGKYNYGDGRSEQDPNYMMFSQRHCNFPSRTFGYWWLSQFRRWGMVKGAPDYKQIASRVAPRRHCAIGRPV